MLCECVHSVAHARGTAPDGCVIYKTTGMRYKMYTIISFTLVMDLCDGENLVT